ncbi:MAG: hypothetical protein WC607_00150 [Candidatus Micrarchaeia archaeon]
MGFLDFLHKSKPKARFNDLQSLVAQAREKEFERELPFLKAKAAEAFASLEAVRTRVEAVASKPGASEARDEWTRRITGAVALTRAPGESFDEINAFHASLATISNSLAGSGVEDASVVKDYPDDYAAVRQAARNVAETERELRLRLEPLKKRVDALAGLLQDSRALYASIAMAQRAHDEADAKKERVERAARDASELAARLAANAPLAQAAREGGEYAAQAEAERRRLAEAMRGLVRSFRKMESLAADQTVRQLASKFAFDPAEAFLAQGGDDDLLNLLKTLATMPGEEANARAASPARLLECRTRCLGFAAKAKERERATLPLKALENELESARRRELALVREANEAREQAERFEKEAAERRFELNGKAHSLLGVDLADA